MDQSLNSFSTELISKLTEFCKDYFTECLHENKGFNIIYSVKEGSAEFEKYFSTCNEIMGLIDPDLSKEESINRIVYVIDCEKFVNYDLSDISEMSYHMAFLLFGIVSGATLMSEFRFIDVTEMFVNNVKI